MKSIFLLLATFALFAAPAVEPAKAPIVNDTALKIELLVTTPDVEACTTVCGAPDGSFYVGNDPRDGRLSNSQPVNTIVRFSSLGADRQRTVFADKIFSPAGSAWHDGYLYVLHDPFLTRFKDTDGDGIADVREDLITNLGIVPNEGLNDHVVSGFTLGMDGCFYISVGDRGIFEAKSVKDGSTITMRGGGIIRCRTDGTQLEIFSTGTRNHLQVNLDAEDNAFTRDNTDDGNGWWTRLTHHIEGGYYGYPYEYRKALNYGVTQPSQQTLDAIKQHGGNDEWKMTNDQAGDAASQNASAIGHSPLVIGHFLPAMADFGGGSPTGGLCYLSDGLPEQYRGKHFFSEWGKAGVFVTEVARDGATFKLVSDTKLIEPEKRADFRPMQLSVAADGSLLIADWGYGGWKSPKVAGAIWRLSWPEAKPAPRLKDEGSATIDELLAALGHPDRDQRLRAEYALAEKGGAAEKSDAIAGKLAALAKDKSVPVVARTHALWALAYPIAASSHQPGVLAEISRGSSAATTPGATAPGTQSGGVAEAEATTSASPAARVATTAEMKLRVSPGANLPQPSGLVARAMGITFRDNSPVIRSQAIRACANAGLTVGITESAARTTDTEPAVRLAAVTALGRFRRALSPEELELWAKSEERYSAVFTQPVLALFQDSDVTVRFAAIDAGRKTGAWRAVEMGKWNRQSVPPISWQCFAGLYEELAVLKLAGAQSDTNAEIRARAVEALGRIAYQPVPYDGHWWGTQPVKSPAPLNSVAWAGTPAALAALTAALGDADSGVRLAAAKAFTAFTLGGTRSGASQTPMGGGGREQGLAGASPSEEAAAAALRTRLTAESDAAVRRQLIEALGVQKDPQAMEVFREIALGDPDMDFRETAIGAVVNIGGDAAKKTIAQLADAQLSPAATRTIIKAAGELKVLEAAPALIAHLKDEDAGNREFAAKSLQQLGPKSNAGPALIEALSDKDGKTQAAAIEALGSFREKAALPALLALAEKKKSMKETIGALANMPDESAIPVLVETLRDKNTSVRRNAIKALKTMREKAWPQVEALLASGRVPEELVPEIRNAFESGAITRWKMVGVFENVWDAQHPPEKEMLSLATDGHGLNTDGQKAPPASVSHPWKSVAEFLAKKYHNAEGRDVGWIDVTADGTEGRVDLEKVFKTNAMVCAYAFTEIDAPEAADAKLFTSADDEIAVWVNGAQVLNVSGSHGYEPDQNETPVHLKAGKNSLFVKIGNKSGPWVFHARLPGFDNGKFIKSKETPPDEKQRLFSLASRLDGTYVNPGNAANGEKIFFDPAGPLGGICATCHAVRGKGGQVGPDLGTIAANYKRPDLITSLHEPSKTIALGFEQFIVETKGGEIFAGAVRQETADALTLVGADAQSHAIKTTDVKTKTAVPTSLMPQGLTLGLKPQDFADLLAYLETLTGK